MTLEKPLNIEKEVQLKSDPEMGVFPELEMLEKKDNEKTVKRAKKVQRKRVKSRIGSEVPDLDLERELKGRNMKKSHKTKSVDDEFVLVDSEEDQPLPKG